MTAIAAIAKAGTVWMGGDSAAGDTNTWQIYAREDPKVFVKGQMIFGFTSSFRMGDILRYRVDIPEIGRNQDIDSYMRATFIACVRRAFGDEGFLKSDNGRQEGGEFLVGYAGRLFHIDSDFQVGEPACGYMAVGSGAAVCLGSLFSSVAVSDQTMRISQALKAAETFNAFVKGPFVILEGGDA